jgi:hypothetical protein
LDARQFLAFVTEMLEFWFVPSFKTPLCCFAACSDYVLHHAPCPVLFVKKSEKQESTLVENHLDNKEN